MTKLIRQGDVLLKPVAFLGPTDGEVEDGVLARGEVTGHSHRIEGGKVLRSGQQLYVVVEEESAKLVHEEHNQLTIPRGIYEVVRQREYSPLDNRTVMD